MSEYNKKRLYWIKLSESFMTSDTVDFLMEQKDGANYVVLYQLLCLKTINNNGELSRKLGEVIVPYDEEKIQRDAKWFSIDTVRIALELYKKLGLIYKNENGNLAITDFNRLIGSTTVGAEKKQIQIANREGGKIVEIIPPDIDIDKEKDIEIDIDDDDKYIERINIIKDLFQNVILDERLSDEVDTKLLSEKVNGSGYLKHFEKLTISWLNKNYQEIIADKYKDFATNKQTTNFEQRTYKPSELNELFDDLDNVDI